MALVQNPDASILAVSHRSLHLRHVSLHFYLTYIRFQSIEEKLYSVKPNSMPEERTVSVFTRMNTAQRNAQEVRTHRHDPNTPARNL